MSRIIDILHETQRTWLDPDELRQALTFAFATGGGSDAFTRILARVETTSTSFNPSCFAADLFLDTFVERCLGTDVRHGGRCFQKDSLRRILAHPPRACSDVHVRHSVFRELLASSALREGCFEVWRSIDALRVSLEASELGRRSNAIARRLEILRLVAALPQRLETTFARCHSPLHRVAEFAQAERQSPPFDALDRLVDHDDHLASLELLVRVGRDGQVRRLDIVHVSENRSNPHHRSALLRFYDRARAWFRGYAVHEREILGRLVEAVFDDVAPFIAALFQLGLQLEFYLALSGLVDKARALRLEMCLPEFHSGDTGESTHFERLFNPFLMLDGQVPVPCDLQLDDSRLVLLTGPNSGGKTRILQALGLAQLLAQSGAPTPAASAQVRWRSGMFVSLVHEVSVDQREGRLGTELMRIRRLFERIGYNDLVLLDELCAGTNPSEGEEIVELVISLLSQLEPQAFISTHFLQFAARLERVPPVHALSFLQVALDARQRPLYQFVPGVATTSLATKTAERLGVTREALEALIRDKRASLAPPPSSPTTSKRVSARVQ